MVCDWKNDGFFGGFRAGLRAVKTESHVFRPKKGGMRVCAVTVHLLLHGSKFDGYLWLIAVVPRRMVLHYKEMAKNSGI